MQGQPGKRLGIRVNCFAVPYGFYNQHVKDVAKNAGYEAVVTVYGQPITFRSTTDSLGRYPDRRKQAESLCRRHFHDSDFQRRRRAGRRIWGVEPSRATRGWRDDPHPLPLISAESFRLWRDRPPAL